MTRTSEDDLVAALRAGDERAFADVVDAYSPAMLAVARSYVATREVAEEVVQDAWLALLKGIDRFEGRSSLRTWLFRMLINIAKTRGVREHRTVLLDDGPTVDSRRFRGPDDPYPRNWAHPPAEWHASPERSLLAAEALQLVEDALEHLPEQQRLVVTLRDIDGFDADEVCTLLELSAGNQRVLLHRGRAKIRTALAQYFEVAS